MALSDQEEFELLSLEREKANAPIAATPAPAPVAEPATLRGRSLQSLPRSLAFGTEFNRAPNTGGLSDLDTGAYIAGGKITDLTGSPALGTAVRMAPDIAETLAGGGIPGMTLGQPMKSGAERMMQWAINPTTADVAAGKAAKAARTMLDEGVNTSVSGMEALRAKALDLNKQVYSILNDSGKTISKDAVGSYIQGVISRIEKTSSFPQDPLRAVERVYDQFLTNGLIPKNIPVVQAQELKQGIYSELKKKYGVLGTDTEEAMKAVGRGYKGELEKAVPEVAGLNAESAKLWNAMNVTERKAYSEIAKTPGGFAFFIHNPEVATAYMATKSALFKSLVARAMDATSRALPGGVGGGAVATAEALRKE